MSTLITSGQKDNFVGVVVAAVRKGMEKSLDQLVKSGTITTSNFQKVLAQGNALAEHLIAEAMKKMTELAEGIVGYLKFISGDEKIFIAATDGKGTIAEAMDVFTGGIDKDFKNWGLDVAGKPTKRTKVQVHEMVKDGTFEQMFGSNPDHLCFEQDQIVSFVKKHKKWLRTDGCATFFLFKVKGKFFVAGVVLDSGRPNVYVDGLDYDYVWDAENRRRFVSPQQEL